MCTIFRFENLEERDQSKVLGVDRRIILELILGKLCGEGVDRMHLA
jgi:hypothetical protein